MTALVERKNNWEATESNFQWEIPDVFNIAEAVCDRHAEDSAKVALIHENESGTVESWTFRQIQQYANRLANAMEALGICEGDRVGIVLPQSPETGIAHIAIYKIGAVALPLTNLFGPEALNYRFQDTSAKAVITDRDNREKIQEIHGEFQNLEFIIQTDEDLEKDELNWRNLLENASDEYRTKQTSSEAPCWVTYTSGTTRNPRCALHAHRALLGHLPGYELSHDFCPSTRGSGLDSCGLGLDRWAGQHSSLFMVPWHPGSRIPIPSF